MLLTQGDLIPVEPEATTIPWTRRKSQILNFLHRGPVDFNTLVYDTNVGDISAISTYFNPERVSVQDLNSKFGQYPSCSQDKDSKTESGDAMKPRLLLYPEHNQNQAKIQRTLKWVLSHHDLEAAADQSSGQQQMHSSTVGLADNWHSTSPTAAAPVVGDTWQLQHQSSSSGQQQQERRSSGGSLQDSRSLHSSTDSLISASKRLDNARLKGSVGTGYEDNWPQSRTISRLEEAGTSVVKLSQDLNPIGYPTFNSVEMDQSLSQMDQISYRSGWDNYIGGHSTSAW